jgi:iron(II)-dependent oxidoreductase
MKRRYPWGDEWGDERCNAGGSETTAVTAHPTGASLYDVEDLLGNVQEWTRSSWGNQPHQPDYRYPYNQGDHREVLTAQDLPGQLRLVHRGGSFNSLPADMRCTARGHATPNSRVAWRGLRVVMVLQHDKQEI